MNSGNGEGNPLFAGNSLVSRLYTDSKGSKSLNPNKARGTVLSTSKSTPSMKKPNDLVLQYTNAKLEPSPIGGNVKTLLQSSPIKQLKSSDRPDGFIQDRPIKYEPPPTASERLVTTFIDSLNLSAKEKFDLFHIPQYFMYLQRKPEQENTMHEVPRSVYDLETVNQDKVDKVVYFTISKEGITQFAKDSSHFTPLDKWEREFKIFHKMAKINFFKLYKRWKVCTLLISLFLLHADVLMECMVGLHGMEEESLVWQDARRCQGFECLAVPLLPSSAHGSASDSRTIPVTLQLGSDLMPYE